MAPPRPAGRDAPAILAAATAPLPRRHVLEEAPRQGLWRRLVEALTFGDRDAAVSAVLAGAMLPAMVGLPLNAGAATEIAAPESKAKAIEASSETFRRIASAALEATRPGTVPASVMISTANDAESKVLIDPQQIFEEVGRRIERARAEIDIQTFRWSSDSDPVRATFASLVRLQDRLRAEGAAKPVRVRLVIDAMRGGLNMNLPTEELFDDVRATVRKYGLDPRWVRVQLAAHEHSGIGAVHSKMFLIDGETLVITGANMNYFDSWDYSIPRSEPVNDEHDAAFVLRGEIARAALADFDDVWLKSRIWVAPGPAAIPAPIPIHGRIPVEEATRHPRSIAHDLPETTEPTERPIPMMFVSKQAHDGLSAEEGERADYPLNRTILAMFDAARSEVVFETANLNAAKVMDKIVETCARGGVVVKAVLTKGFEDFSESLPGQGGTNAQAVKELYRRLAAAHIPTDRLEVRWSRASEHQPGSDVGGEARSSHVKFVAVDRAVALVTSSNLDTQSWGGSREIGVLVDDAATTSAWVEQLFDRDFARALPITRPWELGVDLPQLWRTAHFDE